jgi:hypothetical protein
MAQQPHPLLFVSEDSAMKKLLAVVILSIAAYAGFSEYRDSRSNNEPSVTAGHETSARGSDAILARAFENQTGKLQVAGTGTVSKILKDDNDGRRHQKFVLRLESGQTLLVAHNIDLAPRIDSLREGDAVEFNGQYDWNPKGGVIHWTHLDPTGRHVAGWIRHNGKTYQ